MDILLDNFEKNSNAIKSMVIFANRRELEKVWAIITQGWQLQFGLKDGRKG